MSSIKPLPEAVRGSVRSGIILCDLTRVVEELIFNSIDAGATKVSVAVGVRTCYVKVVDNGFGITRDGLVLTGERYATSKSDLLADMDTGTGSFGFRGEALGSIADVAVLEIVSKAHGRPNGYRKVMKGCKCLYMGIDDERQDVGTTVIARDLFYNQPVRRKLLQSNPKKFLHSIKESVLRIALVHLKISFRLVDIESEDEVLKVHPSSSPLPLLTSGFGIAVSSSLQELDVSDSVLKLSGYISGPCETLSVKAFQYVYINSRFIFKSQIHKLLGQLAATFSSDTLKSKFEAQIGKRSRSQIYPTYILNLSCPRSHYDLTFEPSRTSVEFKDWDRVLTFVEKVITRFWSRSLLDANSLSHCTDMHGKDNMWMDDDYSVSTGDYLIARKRCKTQSHRVSLDLQSPQPKMLKEKSKHTSLWEDGTGALGFEDNQIERGFAFRPDFSFEPSDISLAQCRTTIKQENGCHLRILDNKFCCSEGHLLENDFDTEKCSDESDDMDCILDSRWEDMSLKVDANTIDVSAECFGICNDMEKDSENLNKSFLRSCSSRRRLLADGEFSTARHGFELQVDEFRTQNKWLDHDGVEIGEVDDYHSIEPWQNEAPSVWSSDRLTTPREMRAGSEFLAMSTDRDCFAEEYDIPPDAVAQVQKISPRSHSLHSECSPLRLDLLNAENFADEEVGGRLKFDRNARCKNSADHEGIDDNARFDTTWSTSIQENCCLTSCMNVSADLECFTMSDRNLFEFGGYNLDGVLIPKCHNTISDGKESLCLNSFDKGNTSMCAAPPHHISSSTYVDKDGDESARVRYQQKPYSCEERGKRSQSAPPCYRGKKKFFALNTCSSKEAMKSCFGTIQDSPSFQENIDVRHQEQTSRSNLYAKPGFINDSMNDLRPGMETLTEITDIQNYGSEKLQGPLPDIFDMKTEDVMAKEAQDPLAAGIKWRNSNSQTANGEKSNKLYSQDATILDISSGILHLAGDSLIPNSISKNCLEGAKVLQQVDRKFIPVVAGRTLAIIDQHAADERIRLEELRQKVLCGEMKTTTYLDAEQELVLPELGYQLLHNYAEQIQNWGWSCNIHAQSSRNLHILHRQPSVTTLLAVPCILGVNLTDADLLEYLQQLADTDGSSTIPPSVLRVLNFKACRGAIMFGDKLLPSECSLIVEELKRTSMCFQCAHGRPTTVPLVNLEALHKQRAKLGSWSDGSAELWHGLRRHEISLERAALRLSSAGGQC